MTNDHAAFLLPDREPDDEPHASSPTAHVLDEPADVTDHVRMLLLDLIRKSFELGARAFNGCAWFQPSDDSQRVAPLVGFRSERHGAIHVDAVAGREHTHQLLTDLPTVFLPPALVI